MNYIVKRLDSLHVLKKQQHAGFFSSCWMCIKKVLRERCEKERETETNKWHNEN